MKIPKLTATIKSIVYKSIESTSKQPLEKYYSKLELDCFYDIYGENIDQIQYYADVDLNENKCGKQTSRRKKEIWKCTLYIDEETYDLQKLNVGDILELTNLNLASDNFKVSVYDREKLKNYPNEKTKNKYLSTYKCTVKDKADTCFKCKHKKTCIEKENYIQPHATLPIISARLSCKDNSWKVKYKFDEIYYGKVGKIKFPFFDKKDLTNYNGGEYYISKEEYNKLLEFDGNETAYKCYDKKIKFKEYNVLINLDYRKDIDKYWCEIILI